MQKSANSNSKMRPLLIAAGLSAALLYTGGAQAELQTGYTHYVTDSVEIPLRSQPGYKYKILRMVRSGAAVTILEVNEDGWAKLLYKHNGKETEGWMPSIVLQSQPIAKMQLQEKEKKIARIEKQLNQLNLEKETLQNRFSDTDNELKEVKQQNFELNKQLEEIEAISGQSIKLNEENQRMVQEIERLNNENAIMKEQIDQAEDVVQRHGS
ncbi:TIGR04211 family SH3 domain-containing protein [Thiomicrospira sp. S5]|uniref:TIGR04211 family SH3 domain-containing protein n=1 Tax=Thiomicrospira sp. S5 TaxID=1803865 RepID=UPI001F167E5B|nr:TIGR04211 family SH3 domain-containing protein [Thiomicrospira sp. S5]